MTRLCISVEGKSERMFVEDVLMPHLLNYQVDAKVQDMKGNIGLDRIASKLNRLIHNYDCVTTLYDFYGFRKRGLDNGETKDTLEQKIKDKIKISQQNKIIPYIQMYEFEALLFSDAEKMANELNTNQKWINKTLSEFNNIETINNSKETAPSKRIANECCYIKTTHAPKILQEIGLPKIREKCQGFNAWLTQLEKLGE